MTNHRPDIQAIIDENTRRRKANNAYFNPATGEGSTGERYRLEIPDFPIPVQYLPVSMRKEPLIRQIEQAGSVAAFYQTIVSQGHVDGGTAAVPSPVPEDDYNAIVEQFTRIRFRHDFAFWAFILVFVKNKDGGDNIQFRLRRPQRRLVERLEARRLAGMPIRLILLKARQWGGSTCIQMYMAWLQLVHMKGLNSLIVAQVNATSYDIKDMYDRMIEAYPVRLLHEMGEAYNEREKKMVGVGQTGNTQRIPQRNCKIKIGSAQTPNSARGGDYSLVHCSEVGVWKKTEGKSPEDIVRSACSGITYSPNTMIVYESTANGTGNFFHREYKAAKMGKSQFEAMFVPWFEIDDLYEIPFCPVNGGTATVTSTGKGTTSAYDFAEWLYDNRLNENAMSDREQPGQYLWWLWEKGATLEAIQWYILERSKYHDHGDMASEYPSDDIEAFVHSGTKVFNKYKVEQFRRACKAPKYVGDVYADGIEGKEAMRNVRFIQDRQGQLWVWALPEIDKKEKVTNRYLVVVDIGGRSRKADWSVITVFDRYWMMDGERPTVVAQWYGHIDMDILAWKAAMIAAFYDNALLVIESNTLETKDRNREVDGDQSQFILNEIKDVYPNLYARKQSADDIAEGRPIKYGFHTNTLTKPKIIAWLVKVIRERLYVERDDRCLDEYMDYEQNEGRYEAQQGKHDDLLMTRAIGLWICFKEMPIPTVVMRTQPVRLHKKTISAATI